jgi:hypothetical protein
LYFSATDFRLVPNKPVIPAVYLPLTPLNPGPAVIPLFSLPSSPQNQSHEIFQITYDRIGQPVYTDGFGSG